MKTFTNIITSKITATSAVLALSVLSAMAVLPAYATAPTQAEKTTTAITTIVNTIGGVMVTILFIAFFWSLAKFITAPAEEKGKQKQMLIWTSLAMLVGLSIWGVVAWVGGLVGIEEGKVSQDARHILPK